VDAEIIGRRKGVDELILYLQLEAALSFETSEQTYDPVHFLNICVGTRLNNFTRLASAHFSVYCI
jgi:hypothetical protein